MANNGFKDFKEAEVAHEAYQALDRAIVAIGKATLVALNTEQRDYVVNRLSDEFRFWRITDE